MYAMLISLPYVRLGIVFFWICKMSSVAWRRQSSVVMESIGFTTVKHSIVTGWRMELVDEL